MDWGNQCLKPDVGGVCLPVLYDCWKMCVMMGAICSAVSLLRTLCGSSAGPVALFWLRFFNCLIIPCVPVSREGMLEYNEGSITGMGNLSLVNTQVNWLLRAFALSRSFVIGLSFTLRVGIPMFSRLFVGSCQCLSSLSSKFPKLSQCSFNAVCFAFLLLLFRLLCIRINSRDIHGM